MKGTNIFTKRALEECKVKKTRYRISDSGSAGSVNGLHLDVLVSGKKVFRFRRKYLGKDTSVTIGEFPLITIEQARKRAKQIASDFTYGKNPNEVKKAAIQENKRQKALSMSIAELFEAWESEFLVKIKIGERRSKSLEDARSTWSNHLKGAIGHFQITDIKADTANTLLKQILIKTSVSVRNKCLTLLKSMYAEQEANPFIKIKKLAETRRERILSKEEVGRLLESLTEESQVYQDIVMLLLLTGQRKYCVLSMEWGEIDHEQGIWLIPTTKMKAKKAHAVPLTDEAMEILTRRSSEATAGERYVFPSSQSKTGHIAEKSAVGSFWYRITERAGLRGQSRGENVTIHDLRRTIASWSVMRGGNIQTTSKLLGHSDISITASTYAHLDIEHVRRELGITTAALLGRNLKVEESRVERLVREIKQLSPEERRELMGRI
ncbi:tyrosine-type recombinase/integrase [Shewanella corallii]|uniref:Tyrosine-type recombinase/integrase n=1 Tax=Shewanella corallii TaxID=560080 RepID=A0ABT0N4I1_9GAMM|nr:site-specific integrase [Shewanella corallii]MCL2913085.1 tyrosine-type recombinase/integrase [Shewanella corallii]